MSYKKQSINQHEPYIAKSICLPLSWIGVLRGEAERRGISVSALTREILREYVQGIDVDDSDEGDDSNPDIIVRKNMNLDADVYGRLKDGARSRGISISEQIRDIISGRIEQAGGSS